jgi:hypothetical protein
MIYIYIEIIFIYLLILNKVHEKWHDNPMDWPAMPGRRFHPVKPCGLSVATSRPACKSFNLASRSDQHGCGWCQSWGASNRTKHPNTGLISMATDMGCFSPEWEFKQFVVRKKVRITFWGPANQDPYLQESSRKQKAVMTLYDHPFLGKAVSFSLNLIVT